MKYLIDSDVLIRAKNQDFPFEVAPGFWDWLVAANARDLVAIVPRVRQELLAQDDELSAWIKLASARFTLSISSTDFPRFTELTDWVQGGQTQFGPAAVNEFLGAGDYELVALAAARGSAVVTHEVSSDGFKKVKIPNACAAMGVFCVRPHEMLFREGVRLVLG